MPWQCVPERMWIVFAIMTAFQAVWTALNGILSTAWLVEFLFIWRKYHEKYVTERTAFEQQAVDYAEGLSDCEQRRQADARTIKRLQGELFVATGNEASQRNRADGLAQELALLRARTG